MSLEPTGVHRQATGEGGPSGRSEHVGNHPIAGRIFLDAVKEQDRGIAFVSDFLLVLSVRL